MRTDRTDMTDSERIGRLETAIEGLAEEFHELRVVLKSVQEKLSGTRETNWTVVISAMALLGALYAAAIRPLETDAQRQQNTAAELAKAVILQNERLNSLTTAQAEIKTRLAGVEKDTDEIRIGGSPGADKRLNLIEYRLDHLAK